MRGACDFKPHRCTDAPMRGWIGLGIRATSCIAGAGIHPRFAASGDPSLKPKHALPKTAPHAKIASPAFTAPTAASRLVPPED